MEQRYSTQPTEASQIRSSLKLDLVESVLLNIENLSSFLRVKELWKQ